MYKRSTEPVHTNNVAVKLSATSGGTNFHASVAKREEVRSYAAISRGARAAQKSFIPSSQYKSVSLADVAKKLDLIMQMVSRREALLQNHSSNE